MVVENQAESESLAACVGKFSQPRKIPARHRRTAFDFDANDVSLLVFDDDVDLVVVSVLKVVELEMAATPSRKLEEFGSTNVSS